MTNEEFAKIAGSLFEECMKTIREKGEVYTRGTGDRLFNFKKTGEDLGLSPEQVCGVFMHKHLDAVMYHIRSGKEGPEGLKENIKDAINYLILYLAIKMEKDI